MEKYKYGPLVYNIASDEDDEGNYYWNGLPPVGYDQMGIPIDKEGMQCLPIASPLHPSYEPVETEYNSFLKMEIPSISSCMLWFDDNFISISEEDCKFYILRWLSKNYSNHSIFSSNSFTTEKAINKIWLDEQQS